MADRFERLSTAVETAAGLAPKEADTFLREHLGDDPPLLAEARDILEAGRRTDGFLTPKERPRPAAIDPGMSIGPFRIRATLGRGGMGTVFLADQEHPTRCVALKVLGSPLFTPSIRDRFRQEIQALASLKHPGIAQIYDAGVHVFADGPGSREVPWLAMEYVEDAASLVTYADRRALSTEERLRLFLDVLEAVQHGHQKGIVHRDLKPDNILVSGEGHPKVIDFGVARVTDVDQQLTTMRSGVGEIVGTLPYMAPEHVAGTEAAGDIRADVYSLGVVLYQLLLDGELPIPVDRADFVTSARHICEAAPRRPSAIDRRLTGDLEAILLKALAKEPTRRYASAEAFASDIRRYLELRPVEARPPSVWYQLRLFSRRRMPLVVAAGAVVATLVGATIVSTHFALRSRQAENIAIEERDDALLQRARTDRMFETLLEDSFRTTMTVAPAVHRLAGGNKIVKHMITAVRSQLATLSEIAGDDPRLRALLAETHLRVGDLEGNRHVPNLGNVAAAEASYRRALAISLALQAADPTGWRPRCIEVKALRKLAELKPVAPAEAEAAGALWREALRKAREIATEAPGHVEVEREVARLLAVLAQLAQRQQKPEEALRLADLYIEACGAGAGPAMDGEPTSLGAALGHRLRGYALKDLARPEEALEALDRCIAITEPHATADDASYEDRRRFTNDLTIRGTILRHVKRYAEAERDYERTLAILEDLIQRDPEDARVRMRRQVATTFLASIAEEWSQEPGIPKEVARACIDRAIQRYRSVIRMVDESESPRAEAWRAEMASRIERLERMREGVR